MQDLFSPSGGSVLIGGIGAFGCRVASRGAADAGSDPALRALWCAAHSDRRELIASGLEPKLYLPFTAGPFAKMTVERQIAEQEEEVASFCAGRSLAILLGADDENSALLMSVLASMLRDRGLYVMTISAELPMNAERASGDELDCADLSICFPLNSDPAPNALVGEMESAVEDSLLLAAETVLIALNSDGSGALTIEALRQTFRGRAAVNAAIAVSTSEPLNALALSLAKLGMDEATSSGILAILTAGRDVTVSEAQNAAQSLRKALVSTRSPLLCFNRHSRADEQVVCLVLAQPNSPRPVVVQRAHLTSE